MSAEEDVMTRTKGIALVSGVVGAAAVVGIGVARPAMAAAPTITSYPFTESQTDTSLCGVPIVLTFAGTVTEHDFFDGLGNLVRVEVHSADVATASGPSGTMVSGHEVVDIRVDIDHQTEKHTGVPIHFGGLLIEAGRILIDASGGVTVSGRHQLLEGDVARFCSALA
ncbi:MAG: hypothetical protein QOH89_1458 [Pseudonocardiales bacterium]|nr:hypothetical protein [Pseudonocardiales bacterium]